MSTRSHMAADPREMVRTLRALIAECDRERKRLRKELATWLEAAGVRPDDGSDQPCLFAAERQPSLFGG